MTTHTDAPADDLACDCVRCQALKDAADELDGLRVTEEICADRIARRAAADLTRLEFFATGGGSMDTKPQRAEARKAMRAGLARIRSLEAQRDEAVGLLRELSGQCGLYAIGGQSIVLGNLFPDKLKLARAFLDSLKGGR